MALILLRHTRPLGGEGLCYGRLDIDLAPDFETAAASVERRLPAVAAIVTSPSRRCRLLAARIARTRRVAVTEDRRLREMDFGSWEGRHWSAIPRGEIDAWAADPLEARPHSGESVSMLVERVGCALAEWRKLPGTVLLVSHGGVARAARSLAGVAEPWTTHLAFGDWIYL